MSYRVPALAHDRFLGLQVGPQGKVATLNNAIAGHAAFMPDRSHALALIKQIGAKCASGAPTSRRTELLAGLSNKWQRRFATWKICSPALAMKSATPVT